MSGKEFTEALFNKRRGCYTLLFHFLHPLFGTDSFVKTITY